MDYQIDDIRGYLKLESPHFIKRYLFFEIILISLIGITTAIVDPFKAFLFCMIIPLVAIVDAWAILIMFFSKKYQKAYILFSGVFCIAFSLICMLTAFQIIYFVLKNHSPIFIILTSIFYILILVTDLVYHINAIRKGFYHKDYSRRDKKINKGGGAVIFMAGFGTLLCSIFGRALSENVTTSIYAVAHVFMAYIFALGVTNIHKFYIVKKY